MDNSIPPINASGVESSGLADADNLPTSTNQNLEGIKNSGALEALATSSDYSSTLIDAEINVLLGDAGVLTNLLNHALNVAEA